MTDAASLAFWWRVEQKAWGRYYWAHFRLGHAVHTRREMDAWVALLQADRTWQWAQIHRCMAERPRSALWYVKAGA